MRTTTVGSLINALQDIADKYGDETPILATHQPNYPLVEKIVEVAVCHVNDGDIVSRDIICDDCGVYLDDSGLCPSCLPYSERTEADKISKKAEDEKPLAFIALNGHPFENDGYAGFHSPYGSSELFYGGDTDDYERFLDW